MTKLSPEAAKVITEFHDHMDRQYKPYTGEYEKELYDIVLKDGREWLNCWPNADTFYNQQGTVVRGAFVQSIRPAKNPPGEA